MDLTAQLEPDETAATSVLVGRAVVVVSGRLAQFGSRVLVPVSDALPAQFVDNFRAATAAVPGTTEAPEAVASAPPVKGLNAFALMWTIVKGGLAGLAGKRT